MTRAYRCSVWFLLLAWQLGQCWTKIQQDECTTIPKNEKLSVFVYLKGPFQNLAIPIWQVSDVLGSYRQSNLESSRILSQSMGSYGYSDNWHGKKSCNSDCLHPLRWCPGHTLSDRLATKHVYKCEISTLCSIRTLFQHFGNFQWL